MLYFQGLEDSTMRNVLRSVATETHFNIKDLEELFLIFKVKYTHIQKLILRGTYLDSLTSATVMKNL